MYGHVSGNWCWILPDARFRYGLTHGWRMAIFVVTIAIYTVIYVHLKRVFNKIRLSNTLSATTETSEATDSDIKLDKLDNEKKKKKKKKRKDQDYGSGNAGRKWRISAPMPQENFHTGGINSSPPASTPIRAPAEVKFSMEDGALARPYAGYGNAHTSDEESFLPPAASMSAHGNAMTTTTVTGPRRGGTAGGFGKAGRRSARISAPPMPAPPNLKRMLLMNGYPIAYIILWIPGMVNRLVEVVHGSSPVWLRALQASTQFVGLANAVTYGLNEQARGRWSDWRKRSRSGAA